MPVLSKKISRSNDYMQTSGCYAVAQTKFSTDQNGHMTL